MRARAWWRARRYARRRACNRGRKFLLCWLNDAPVAGIRLPPIAVPLGTYTGCAALKSRQIGEAELAAVDVQAAELGAAVELGKDLAGVEDLRRGRRRT